jgi:hypothetical protein
VADDKLLLFRNLVLKQISSILVWSPVQTNKSKEASNKIVEMINHNKRRNINPKIRSPRLLAPHPPHSREKHEARTCRKGRDDD